MTDFKIGDRVKYKGTRPREGSTPRMNGQIGTVTKVAPDSVQIRWDSGEHFQPFPDNIVLYTEDEKSADPVADVFAKYVSEFDRIVNNDTSVDHYTALGFLSEFLREVDEARR